MNCPLPLIVEPDQLEPLLERQDILAVDLCQADVYGQYHIPGAIHLEYPHIIAPRPPAMGLIPGDDHLERLFSGLGIANDTHVVAYDDEGGGKAARLLWTLDVVGHTCCSLLNGGLHAWVNEGHRTERSPVTLAPTRYHVHRTDTALADRTYVLEHLDAPDVVIVDARSKEEYLGSKQLAARSGHIPGAIHWEWTEAMDQAHNLRLEPEAQLRATLQSLGVTPDREIVTYCQTHHRSAYTYIVLKALGFTRVRGYHGSWSEWGNRHDTPCQQGPGG